MKNASSWVAALAPVFIRLFPGAVAALVVASLFQFGGLKPLEYTAYNALFRLRGPQPWDERVVVVAIDDASLKQFGRFPWSRQRYTQLLNLLSESASSVVAMDVLFPESSSEDEALAAAMNRQGQVVLARAWTRGGVPLQPIPVLAQAAAAEGHVLTWEDSDGVTRRMELQTQGLPALGVAAVQVYSLVQSPVNLPSLYQSVWINWRGPVAHLHQYAFADVLSGKVAANTFANKIVLVGVTATGFDSLTSPFDRNPPASGVHLHAALIDNLLHQNFLRLPDHVWLGLVWLLGGPGLSFITTHQRLRWRLILGLGLSAGWGLFCLAWLQAGWLLPIVLPILLIAGTTVAVALYEQRRINVLLCQSEERYALAVQGSSEGLWDWDLKSNLLYLSPRCQEMLGLPPSPCRCQPQEWFDRLHPHDYDRVLASIQTHLDGLTPHFESEHQMQHDNGSYRWTLTRGLAVRDRSGKAYRMAGSQADITERKQAEEQLRYNAFHDALTGLPNRASFIRRLEAALTRSKVQESYLFSVLFLDLDRFKVLNDSLGHTAGDHLLMALAQRLEKCLRSGDTIARLGGDEFTILLENIRDISDATRVAERIHSELTFPFSVGGQEVFTATSIGIVLGNGHYDQPEDLLRDADTAMYRAKTLGKSRSEVFDAEMHTDTMALWQLETDLRRAIDRQEFCIFYQPIVSLKTCEIAGFEALIRWRHPQRGLVPPADFISLAEETGLIALLDWWVLQEACRQLVVWQQLFPTLALTMSVNLSGIQIAQPNLIQRLTKILQDTGLEGTCLKLEVTEGVIMVNGEATVALLEQLQGLGIQICIDDFGTGYSSLGRLHRLPINTLKIDRSFVNQIGYTVGCTGESWEIVRTILALAHNLQLTVVAEGIETVEHLVLLQTLGCEYGQGYFFSQPVTHHEAETLLLATPPWTIAPPLSQI